MLKFVILLFLRTFQRIEEVTKEEQRHTIKQKTIYSNQ